jgi:hypothetical protein
MVLMALFHRNLFKDFIRRKSDDICESIRKRLTGAVAVFEREDNEGPHNDLPA